VDADQVRRRRAVEITVVGPGVRLGVEGSGGNGGRGRRRGEGGEVDGLALLAAEDADHRDDAE
jgi:hypothetical protein